MSADAEAHDRHLRGMRRGMIKKKYKIKEPRELDALLLLTLEKSGEDYLVATYLRHFYGLAERCILASRDLETLLETNCRGVTVIHERTARLIDTTYRRLATHI